MKIKKTISLVLILVTILCVTSNVYAAISYQVNLSTTKSEYKKGEEFIVEVRISNLQTEKGIIAMGARLEYDKNNLMLVGMKGQNGWEDPAESNNSYNPQTGKIAITRSGRGTQGETVFNITFKVIGEKASIDTIVLKEISTSDGTDLAKTADVIATSSENENPSTPNPSNTSSPTVTPNSSSTKKPTNVNNNHSNETKLPQTGVNSTMFLVLGIGIAIITIIVYIVTRKQRKASN